MEINKIHLGDCYELIKQLPDKSVDLIVTDPPYQIESLKGGNNNLRRLYPKELGDNNLDIGIDDSILDQFMRVMKTPNIYIWCNKKQFRQYIDYFDDKGCAFDLITWQKSNAMPLCGGKYMNDCEYCLYFHRGVRLNTKYDTAKTVYVTSINQQDKKDYGHPTIKPLNIIKNLIMNSSERGGVNIRSIHGKRDDSSGS